MKLARSYRILIVGDRAAIHADLERITRSDSLAANLKVNESVLFDRPVKGSNHFVATNAQDVLKR